MNRDLRDFLVDMLTSIDDIASFTSGLSFAEFSSDRKTINAVTRSLEVLGEAAKHLPDAIRLDYPNIPWKYMTGMRGKLIHEYFGVDLSIVWFVSTEELPPLRNEIAMIAAKFAGDNPA